MDSNELARSLRTWRGRVSPAEAGLPGGGRRRVTGLRRQEVAHLAGLSVEYLARLEQGRATHPSVSVLSALARVLQLSDAERAHLFRVADQAEPSRGGLERQITPSVQRILDRLTDTPVLVVDASWQCITANPLAYALTGDTTVLPPRAQNLAWTAFTGAPNRYIRTEEEERLLRIELVADLREALGRHPDDEVLVELVAELRGCSADFADLWEQRPAPGPSPSHRTFLHPDVGLITLDSDTLTVRDSDLRLIVFSAGPGSVAAAQLDLLAGVGLQPVA
jgi:transcriptional regulator with XRE-family HTH domain